MAALIAVINVPHSSSGSLRTSGICKDVSFFTVELMYMYHFLQATHDWPKVGYCKKLSFENFVDRNY